MDIEWIISSTIERTQGEESEVSTNGSKLLPVQPPRRFSAGRQKLPWEKERKEQSLSAPTRKEVGTHWNLYSPTLSRSDIRDCSRIV